jgi:hypothetical protein
VTRQAQRETIVPAPGLRAGATGAGPVMRGGRVSKQALQEIGTEVRRWGQALPTTTRLLWFLVAVIVGVWLILLLVGFVTS